MGQRSNIGIGPQQVTLTGTTAAGTQTSSWIRIGPFKAANFGYIAAFSTASSAGNRARMQARVSSGSTRGQVSFALVNSSNSGAFVYSGSTGMFSFVRVHSSVLANTRTVTVTFLSAP